MLNTAKDRIKGTMEYLWQSRLDSSANYCHFYYPTNQEQRDTKGIFGNHILKYLYLSIYI